MMLPYLDALDLSRLAPEFEEYRDLIDDGIAKPLINHLAHEGLDVEVGHDLEIVARFQAAHAKTPDNPDGMPVFPLCDPHSQPSATKDDTIVLALMRDGRQVGNLACRLKRIATSLDREIRSLRLFFDDVRAMARRGETCWMRPDIAATVRACWVAFGGAGYLERTERAQGHYGVLVKLMRLLTLTRPGWFWTYQASLLTHENATKIGVGTNGYGKFQAPVFYRLMPHEDPATRAYVLAIAEREEVAADIFRHETAIASRRLNFPTPAEIEADRVKIWGRTVP